MEEIGALCRARKVFFHTDAAQAVGKVPVNVDDMKVDLMSISAHKLYGPKGVGALLPVQTLLATSSSAFCNAVTSNQRATRRPCAREATLYRCCSPWRLDSGFCANATKPTALAAGAIYIRRRPRVRLEALINGGGQERGIRSGTLPAPLAVGLGAAARIAREELDADHRWAAPSQSQVPHRTSCTLDQRFLPNRS